MKADSAEWYRRYAPLSRYVETSYWIIVYTVSAVFNSITEVMEIQRRGLDIAPWEPVVWESTSALSFLLLIPALVILTRRTSLQVNNWRRVLFIYLLASVAYSLGHVLMMVSFREAVYWLAGGNYSFGPWPRELIYEYMKDVRSFLVNVLIIQLYRFVLLRLQGEARILDRGPDPEPDPGSQNRPARFLVKMLGREFLVDAARIEWAQAAGNYVNLHVGERDYPLRSTLSALEDRLDPERFVRVHRSYIVNLDCVASIEPLDSGDARLHML
ncbi:MAG: LytTR family DNA-binding domain-containing protein, partial [Haliea sp.]